MPTITQPITDKCSHLFVSPGVPITSLDGRASGNQISFINFTYNDYAMRRKAEVLKFKIHDNSTAADLYSYVSTKGYYSQAQLKRFIRDKVVDCNASSLSPCSGVIGSNTIYYLNRNVPYHPSI